MRRRILRLACKVLGIFNGAYDFQLRVHVFGAHHSGKGAKQIISNLAAPKRVLELHLAFQLICVV